MLEHAMNPTTSKPLSSPGTLRIVVSTVFFVNGALIASWVSRIPAVSERLGLDKAQLGIGLLGMAVGALIAFPIAGWGIARFGSKPVVTIALIGLSASLLLPGLAGSLPALFISLVAFGALNGATDVGMNAQAVEVEKMHSQPIMSSFHGMWSLGGLLGSGIGALLIGAGFSPQAHFALVGAVAALTASIASSRLLNVQPTHQTGPVFAVPPRSLVAIGVVLFCAALVEGSMADWTAVYLKTSLLTTESFATIGYAAFSLAMLAGRLTGDALKARLGAVALGRSGGLIATIGMAFALVVGQPWASLIGFACVGWGVSSLFPMAFSAAGNAKGVNQGVALAAIATMGYTGFLVGPPLIGFIAQATGLRLALAVVVMLSLVITFGSSTLKASEQSE
jgi:MFS family permease